MKTETLPWILLPLAFLFVLTVRLNLRDMPISSDEGIYCYYGQMVLDGQPPYRYFYEIKPPGLYYAYGFLMLIFGDTLRGIHMAFTVINLLTMAMVFWIGRELLRDTLAATLAAVSFGFLSLGPFVFGFSVIAEPLMGFFSTGALLLGLLGLNREKPALLFLSGIAAHMAFQIKQTGGLFGLGVALVIGAYDLSRRPIAWSALAARLGLYLAGHAALLGIALAAIVAQGAWNDFVFWAYRFSTQYVSEVPMSQGWQMLKFFFPKVVDRYEVFWILAVIGWAGVLFSSLGAFRKWTLSIWIAVSFASLAPGWRFYSHYWMNIVPAVSLAAGAAGMAIIALLKRRMGPAPAALYALLAAALAVGQPLVLEEEYYFRPDPVKIWRRVEGSRPFPEAKVIGDYVGQRTREGETIVVIGTEPEVYFYSGRRCPSRHSYFNYLVCAHPLHREWQKEFIADVEAARPKMFVFFKHPQSHFMSPHADQAIFTWAFDYIQKYYRPVAVADMLSPETTDYVYGTRAETYRPQSPLYIRVFERTAP
ncbi:MAG: hypothetical protein A3G34_12870 [Candidatus Lindowbacteria bacterium RIFCSPLOWO2_12_FULL_62_27]|nr:MAG: hypothetical protein A3G34_12870 [Candidatus Lindowbacteria bacterium RIFCSPLOWO2_12_FULL_62_27]